MQAGLTRIFLLKQACLPVNPAFLLCFVNFIFRLQAANQQGRQRIVLLLVSPDGFDIIICIAVSAQMSAGAVGSDVAAEIARARFPRALISGHPETLMKRLFIHRNSHAAAAVCSELCQFVSLRAGSEHHAILNGNFRHGLSQQELFFMRYRSRLRKIPSGLFV